jgi:hypothetical protein
MALKTSQTFTNEFHVDTEGPGNNVFVIHKCLLGFLHHFIIKTECIYHNQIRKYINIDIDIDIDHVSAYSE